MSGPNGTKSTRKILEWPLRKGTDGRFYVFDQDDNCVSFGDTMAGAVKAALFGIAIINTTPKGTDEVQVIDHTGEEYGLVPPPPA